MTFLRDSIRAMPRNIIVACLRLLKNFSSPTIPQSTMKNYHSMSVQITRGCPFNCEFCDITARFGKKQRIAPIEHTENAFRQMHKLGWRGTVFIVDDNFIGNPKEAIELLKNLHRIDNEIGYSFPKYSEVSVNLSDDTPTMAGTPKMVSQSILH